MKIEGRLEPELWAHAFKIAFCDSPDCGLHIVALREDDTPICEIVMSPAQTAHLVDVCVEELGDKVTTKIRAKLL